MNHYAKRQWQEFRDNVIESDGNRCTVCGRHGSEVVLQVHHKQYIRGRKPWEYGTKDCVTMCKGCHAAEHGHIMPQHGWEYSGQEDLGDLIGTCECCGNSIRHVFYVFHEKWGTAEVGTYCCDNLTDTEIASNLIESKNRQKGRLKRFLDSPRWVQEGNIYKIIQTNFEVEIEDLGDNFSLTIHNQKSKRIYLTLDAAQKAAFDAIDSGKLHDYLLNKKIPFRM